MRRAQAILLFVVLLWQMATGVAMARPLANSTSPASASRLHAAATCRCCDCGGTACCVQRRPEGPSGPSAESPAFPTRRITGDEGLSAPEPPALSGLLTVSFRFLPLPPSSPAAPLLDAAPLRVRFCCFLI